MTEDEITANEAKIADVRRTLRDAEIYDEWGAEYTRNGPSHLTAATCEAIERHLEHRMRAMEANMQNGVRDRALRRAPDDPQGHHFARDETPQPGRMRCTECGRWQYPATPHPACAVMYPTNLATERAELLAIVEKLAAHRETMGNGNPMIQGLFELCGDASALLSRITRP